MSDLFIYLLTFRCADDTRSCPKPELSSISYKRRIVRRLTKHELQVLENAYRSNPYPNYATKENISKQLTVDLVKINAWFVSRRQKEKRLNVHGKMHCWRLYRVFSGARVSIHV